MSYSVGNYAGVSGLLANPAAASGGALKLDLLLRGNDLSFNNSWLGIKREAIKYPTLPDSWHNLTPNVPDNVFKNFIVKGRGGPYSALFQQRVQLPSILYQLNSRNAIAFSSCIRQMLNVDGVSSQFANLFENEFDLNLLQNNVIKNPNLEVIKMTWLEYGFTYAHTFVLTTNHKLRIGISPKILQGIESAYLQASNTEFLLSTHDSTSYFKTDLQLAKSIGAQANFNMSSNSLSQNPYRTAVKAGIDFGIIYEFSKNENDGTKQDKESETLKSKYKLKIGASLVDLGRIAFKKAQNYYDLKVNITQNDVVNYLSVSNKRGIDSILAVDFPANTGAQTFNVLLPAAINTQADYLVMKNFYLNLAGHIPLLNQSSSLKTHDFTLISFTPRYECYWWSAALPLTFDVLSAKRAAPFKLGLNLKAGPVTFGTSDLSFLFSKSPAAVNLYASVKIQLTSLKQKVRAEPIKN